MIERKVNRAARNREEMSYLSASQTRGQDAESGFTLIELLVVILIIGILAAIAIPVFLNQRQAAEDAAVKSDMHTISENMENCLLKDSSSYPDLWVNWSYKTSIPSCFGSLKLSSGTQTHSYDMFSYQPAGWTVPAGQIYCIEIASANNPAGLRFFRSDKGVVSNVRCQDQ